MLPKKYFVFIHDNLAHPHYSPRPFFEVPLDTPPAPPNTPILDISENSPLLKRLNKKKNNIFCCFK